MQGHVQSLEKGDEIRSNHWLLRANLCNDSKVVQSLEVIVVCKVRPCQCITIRVDVV
jgi:hypothetical protein